MICPNCGAELPDTARFCGTCGTPLDTEVLYQEVERPTSGQSATSAPEPEPTPAPAPATDASPRRGGLNRGGKFIAIAFAICLLVGAGLAVVLNLMDVGDDSPSSNSDVPAGEHPVTFYISIEGYGEGGTRIPVQITGTDYEGNKVHKTVFLAYSGVDTTLAAGDYEAEVLGSPIAKDGTLYSYAQPSVSFSISEDLDEGEEYHVDANKYFGLEVIPAEDVTDEQIADALEWARKDEGLDEDIDLDELERLARTRRETAAYVEGDSVSA